MPKIKPNQFVIANKVVTERPILYSTEMVKATLEDRKTQTRRGKGLEKFKDKSLIPLGSVNGEKIKCALFTSKEVFTLIRPPYGQPGDLLWVKETWADASFGGPMVPEAVCFKADYSAEEIAEKRNKGIWKPSIFLRKSAARIWLMIEDVTIERIQDISEVDAIAEGVKKIDEEAYKYDESIGSFASALSAFRALWWEINGPESWKQNPWVWVIKFRVLSKTGRPDNDTILRNFTEVVKEETYTITVKP